MPQASQWGTKVRALRWREHLTQVELAKKLGVSASYLNLIENNRRPLTAPMLVRLAELFHLDLRQFTEADETRTAADLIELFGDPLFSGLGLHTNEIRELASGAPTITKALTLLYRAYRETRDSGLGAQPVQGEALAPAPSEEVSDFIQQRMNHFPALEERAEELWSAHRLTRGDLYRGLLRHLERAHGVRVEIVQGLIRGGAIRRYDPERRALFLSEFLPQSSRTFQLAHQLALLGYADVLDEATAAEALTTPQARALARVALASYFAGALMMPYGPFLEAVKELRYDLELLGARFDASFEQLCHRLTSLRRPGAEGVAMHMLRIDIAGNISKHYSGSGIRFARYAGSCPRWNVHLAFLTPGMVRVQLSQMPDGKTYFCLARTVQHSNGYHTSPTVHAIGLGCRIEEARELVYADGVDLENAGAIVKVGVTCRLCERLDCEQRAFPALHAPLKVDENLRGRCFYAPVG